MIGELQLTTVLLLAGLLWLLLLFIDGVAVQLSWLRQWSDVAPLVLVAIGGFDKWLWRWPIINRWFARRPVLLGTWRVLLTPIGGNGTVAYMVVRQTYSRLGMRLLTPESQSDLVAGEVIRAPDGLYQVVGIYSNRPKLPIRDRSPIHYGAFLVDIHGNPPTRLDGSYWTDRDTKGTMVFTKRRAQLFSTYGEAARAFES